MECTCGGNGETELIDVGIARNWPLFPLVSLRLGDTDSPWEHIYFRVGPLVCKQGMFFDDKGREPHPCRILIRNSRNYIYIYIFVYICVCECVVCECVCMCVCPLLHFPVGICYKYCFDW